MGTYLGNIPIGVVLGAGSSVDNELWFILNGTYLLEKDVIALLNGNYNLKKEN